MTATPSALTHEVSLPVIAGKRIVSIDILRGFTIAAMILVNTAGEWKHAYWPLKHSAWNGCTPTDLVFPTFLFLTGAALVFSFRSPLARGIGRRALMLHTLRRSIVLFLIGIFLNGLLIFTSAHCVSTACCSASRCATCVRAFSIYGAAGPHSLRPPRLCSCLATGS